MPITDTARKNHEELFPNHQSTLKLTDPELIEVFDNFAFDEVLRHGNLDTKTRLMAILASLIAQQTLSEYKVMLGGALNVGVSPIEAKEILYHSVPYVGMAKVFEFIHATNFCRKRRRRNLLAWATDRRREQRRRGPDRQVPPPAHWPKLDLPRITDGPSL